MLSKECHFSHRPAPCWYNIFSFITSLFKLNPILLPHHRFCKISIVSLHHFPSSLICTGDQASSPRRISNNLSFPQLSEVELHSWHFPIQPCDLQHLFDFRIATSSWILGVLAEGSHSHGKIFSLQSTSLYASHVHETATENFLLLQWHRKLPHTGNRRLVEGGQT